GLVMLLAAAPIMVGCSLSRLGESMRVLEDVQADAGPSALKEQTPAPVCETITYRRDGVRRVVDIYRPGGGEPALAGLLLAPGADPDGKDDPRFVAFAESMARARFEVVAPDIPGLRDLRVRAADSEHIRDALVLLSNRRAEAGNATVGVVAISFATGPTTIALLSPDVKGRAHFMLYIGGYYDIEAVITFFTTGWYRDGGDGEMKHRPPNSYGKWFFAVSNADFIDDPYDRALIEWMGRRRLDDPDADLSQAVPRLGQQGRAVYDLLTNTDPDRVPELLAKQPPRARAEIAALDLKRLDLSGLAARFLLVHGNDDRVIPETQSIAFAARVAQAELYLLDSMQHVDPKPAGFGDKLRMLSMMYDFLTERDRERPVELVDPGVKEMGARPCREG
ncbi:MAG: RNA methyltransferase, partial [Pseudomonadota bacterium]